MTSPARGGQCIGAGLGCAPATTGGARQHGFVESGGPRRTAGGCRRGGRRGNCQAALLVLDNRDVPHCLLSGVAVTMLSYHKFLSLSIDFVPDIPPPGPGRHVCRPL